MNTHTGRTFEEFLEGVGDWRTDISIFKTIMKQHRRTNVLNFNELRESHEAAPWLALSE